MGEEKDAQGDYEKFMDDAASKRAEDSKSMTDKEAALADTEDSLVANKEKLKNKNFELMETEKYLGELHAECDWLLKYYEVRKEACALFKIFLCSIPHCSCILEMPSSDDNTAEARTGEIDAMGKAKDVLSGADY